MDSRHCLMRCLCIDSTDIFFSYDAARRHAAAAGQLHDEKQWFSKKIHWNDLKKKVLRFATTMVRSSSENAYYSASEFG